MLEFGACPQCKLDIAPERAKLQPVICNHCGFTVSKPDKEEAQGEVDKKSIQLMVGISVLVLGCYIQISNWDTAWLKIIPLGIKDTIGMSSPADIEAKASICMDLKKWDCVNTQYAKAAIANPELWQRAGHFQMQQAKYNEAAQSYFKYFQAGGKELDASYNYAKALAQLGQVDEATRYFDQVLAARPETLQITVVQNYVKLLMDHQRYDQAKALINKVRSEAGPSGESFMEAEFIKIKDLTTASRD